jgi:hypothetical protein
VVKFQVLDSGVLSDDHNSDTFSHVTLGELSLTFPYMQSGEENGVGPVRFP